MSNLNCVKCSKKLNYLPYHSYAEPPAMKNKDGQFYCFDCFKSVSDCKVCGKSVAQMDINIHDKKTWYQPWEKIYFREAGHIKPFDMCGRYCDFFCSPECLSQDENRNYKLRKNQNKSKLAKGWKYCEACVEMFEGWYTEIGIKKEIRKKALLSHGKVLAPSEKICEFHKRSKEKDTYIKQVIYPKAQAWWGSLTYEEKLAQVKKHDIQWIIGQNDKEGKKATHEEVARHPKVPPFIISQEFEHKEPCITCGKVWKCVNEINCGNDNPNGKVSYCASCPASSDNNKGNHDKNGVEQNSYNGSTSLISEIESKKSELQKLKIQGGSSKEIHKLEQEIQEILLKQEPKSRKNEKLPKSTLVLLIIGAVFVVALFIKLLWMNVKKPSQKKS